MTITAKLADGTTLQFPDGTDPQVIQRTVKTLIAQNGAKSEADTMRAKIADRAQQMGGVQGAVNRAAELNSQAMQGIKDPGALSASIQGAAQGATLNFADEILGGVSAVGGAVGDVATGRFAGMGDRMAQRYSDTQQQVSGMAQDAAFARPKTTIAANIAGGIIGSAPMAIAAGPTVAAAAPTALAGKVAAGAAAGAVAGAGYGAVSGFGRGENGNRLETAANDAVAGGALGGILGGAAPAAGAGIKALAEWVKGKDFRQVAQTLGISNDAAKALLPDLQALDFRAAETALKKAGPDAMLADAGVSTRQALDSAMTGGGQGARIGGDAINARAAASGAKLNRVMDATLGVPQGVKTAAKGIAARTAPMRQKAYDTAYSTAINYADDTGRAIETVLGKIPSKTLQTAINEANDAMKANGVKNLQILADIADDGTVKFIEMPNVQQLDEIKKALGVVGSEVDSLGRPTAGASRANNLARELKAAVGEAVPAYKTAVKLGGDKIAEDRALDMGRKIFGTGVSREQVRETMTGASLEAQDAARQGIREYLDNTLARVRRGIDDPSMDTQETRRLIDTLSTRDAREKLTIVLGKPKAERLMLEIDQAGKQFATRQAVATGSQTGMREARSRALDSVLQPGPVQTAAQGKPLEAMKSIVQLVTRETPANELAKKQAVLGQIAKALTQKRGAYAQEALALIEKAITGQPLKSVEATRLARTLASSGALAAYQTGLQSTKALSDGTQPR